jgi:hypothetical protein
MFRDVCGHEAKRVEVRNIEYVRNRKLKYFGGGPNAVEECEITLDMFANVFGCDVERGDACGVCEISKIAKVAI